jgi:hypothetical protein
MSYTKLLGRTIGTLIFLVSMGQIYNHERFNRTSDLSIHAARLPFLNDSYDKGQRNISQVIPYTEETADFEKSSNNSGHRQKSAPPLPSWVTEYFHWHADERQKMTPESWEERRYLVLRCLESDKRCGGTADRLHNLPVLLRLAQKSQRILFIHWEKPAPLEDFLLPPPPETSELRLDWRLPSWLKEPMQLGQIPISRLMNGTDGTGIIDSDERVVAMRSLHGSLFYDELKGPDEPSYNNILKLLWYAVFVPAPIVRVRVQLQLARLGLTPGEYASAHIRSLYIGDETHVDTLYVHAVTCAAQATNNASFPIFVTSDSPLVEEQAVVFGSAVHHLRIVTHNRSETLHLDRGRDFLTQGRSDSWKSIDMDGFYDVFVDLYLVANSRCVSFGVGGFGRLGALLSADPSCAYKYAPATRSDQCTVPKPIRNISAAKAVFTSSSLFSSPSILPIYNSTTIHLWNNTKMIPKWMKQYFCWHQDARRLLQNGEKSASDYKYLVLRCLTKNKKCSGAADRLKSIPTAIRMAYDSQRLLFLKWERPCALEHFLVPPRGGLDWRIPSTLELDFEEKFSWRDKAIVLTESNNVEKALKSEEVIVSLKSVRDRKYFEEQREPGDYSFEEVYREVWSSVFEPSPPVARLVSTVMEELGLRPGEYVAAHVRALYVQNTVKNREEINALNCASQLGPRATIFFASDSAETTRLALQYGRGKEATIVARIGESEPLHLDRGHVFLEQHGVVAGEHEPQDFYDTFVDLYILAESRCITYGAGGFGSWASLISRNSLCSIRHRTTNCVWFDDPILGSPSLSAIRP